MTTTRSRWTLAVTIVAWTLIAWGGRIGLLTGAEEWESWLRIGGSLLIGVIAAAALVAPWLHPVMRPVLYVLAVWSVLLWSRSLYVNWTGSGSLAFKLVHTVLGVGFFAIAWWAASTAARGDAVPGPDEGNGRQQGDGEPAGLTEGQS